jgi:hypothetical protein
MSAALWREFGEEVAALDGALSSARSSVVRSFDVDATAGIDGAADALRRCADALVAVAERMRASPIARCAWFPVKLTCRHWGSCDCADKAMRVAVVVPVVAEVVEVKPPRGWRTAPQPSKAKVGTTTPARQLGRSPGWA